MTLFKRRNLQCIQRVWDGKVCEHYMVIRSRFPSSYFIHWQALYMRAWEWAACPTTIHPCCYCQKFIPDCSDNAQQACGAHSHISLPCCGLYIQVDCWGVQCLDSGRLFTMLSMTWVIITSLPAEKTDSNSIMIHRYQHSYPILWQSHSRCVLSALHQVWGCCIVNN